MMYDEYDVAKFLLTICLKGHNYVLCVTDGWRVDATLGPCPSCITLAHTLHHYKLMLMLR